MTIGATTAMPVGFAADGLTALELRWLADLLTVEAIERLREMSFRIPEALLDPNADAGDSASCSRRRNAA